MLFLQTVAPMDVIAEKARTLKWPVKFTAGDRSTHRIQSTE